LAVIKKSQTETVGAAISASHNQNLYGKPKTSMSSDTGANDQQHQTKYNCRSAQTRTY